MYDTFAVGLKHMDDETLAALANFFGTHTTTKPDDFAFDRMYDACQEMHARKKAAAPADWYSHTQYKGHDVYHGPYATAEEAGKVQTYLHNVHKHSSIGIEQHATNPQQSGYVDYDAPPAVVKYSQE